VDLDRIDEIVRETVKMEKDREEQYRLLDEIGENVKAPHWNFPMSCRRRELRDRRNTDVVPNVRVGVESHSDAQAVAAYRDDSPRRTLPVRQREADVVTDAHHQRALVARPAGLQELASTARRSSITASAVRR
jgi:hypothetical protein